VRFCAGRFDSTASSFLCSFRFSVQTHLTINATYGVLMPSPGSTLSVIGRGVFICDVVLDRSTKNTLIFRVTQPRVLLFRIAILQIVVYYNLGISSCFCIEI
jgi:hypothetical protein